MGLAVHSRERRGSRGPAFLLVLVLLRFLLFLVASHLTLRHGGLLRFGWSIRLRRTQGSPGAGLVPDAQGEGTAKTAILSMLSPAPPCRHRTGRVRPDLFRRLRLLVDHRIGEIGEGAVSLLFLVEGRIKEPHRVVLAHLFGPALQRAVASDLVM